MKTLFYTVLVICLNFSAFAHGVGGYDSENEIAIIEVVPDDVCIDDSQQPETVDDQFEVCLSIFSGRESVLSINPDDNSSLSLDLDSPLLYAIRAPPLNAV